MGQCPWVKLDEPPGRTGDPTEHRIAGGDHLT
jgi:hypothetical protein